jgi:hypothetical protein
MFAPVTPAHYFAALFAGLSLTSVVTCFARFDAVARRLVAVQRSRLSSRWRRDGV